MTVLENAARVLRCFGPDCPSLLVSEVVQRLGLPKANASRLMKAMRESGMLETIGDSHRHRPGTMMLDLTAAYRRSSVLVQMASEVVAGVTRQFGHTGYVSNREGREVTAVADFPGTNALRVVSSIGRRLPAHLSATGRSLLARMPDDEVAALYATQPGVAANIAPILATARAQGFASSSQETTPGVDAVAVAAADPTSGEAVSLCIVYPHTVVSADERQQIVAALIAGGQAIAARLFPSDGPRDTFHAKEIQNG